MVPETARGTDHTDREVLIISQPQHLRQGNQAKQDHLTPNNARHRRHDHGHDRGHNRNAATCAGQPDIQRRIHVFAMPDRSSKERHKDKQRNRYEDIVR